MKNPITGASKEALFCIGSNCGKREINVERALCWLSGVLSEFRHSSVYASPDCQGSQREYMNAVAMGYTTLDIFELERLSKNFEKANGRDHEARAKGDVPVDVDLVVFEGKVLREKDFRCEFFLKGYREIIG